MKTIHTFLAVLVLGSLLTACGAVSQPSATPFPESMKGYELYSWQEGSQWRFSLLVGTNREKSLEEIKSADTALPGVDALILALEQMPEGQYITWSSRETLSFPPDDIIKQVEKTCEERGLILNRTV